MSGMISRKASTYPCFVLCFIPGTWNTAWHLAGAWKMCVEWISCWMGSSQQVTLWCLFSHLWRAWVSPTQGSGEPGSGGVCLFPVLLLSLCPMCTAGAGTSVDLWDLWAAEGKAGVRRGRRGNGFQIRGAAQAGLEPLEVWELLKLSCDPCPRIRGWGLWVAFIQEATHKMWNRVSIMIQRSKK